MSLSDALLNGLLSLLIIVNPIGAVPVFISLTDDYEEEEKRKTIWRIVKNMGLMLFVFSLVGIYIMDFFSIGIAEMKISGGLMLFITAWKITTTPPHRSIVKKADDISFMPMTMPILSGPATIATLIDLHNTYEKDFGYSTYLITTVMLLIILVITFLTLRSAPFIRRVILKGNRIHIFNKVMGFFILSLSIKFIMEGVKMFMF